MSAVRHATWSEKNVAVATPSHTQRIFEVQKFQRVVEIFVRKLTKLKEKTPFYAIAGCGNSGVPLAGALSYRLGIPMITVRKEGERSVASSCVVTGAVDCGSYVIVDDLVSSGGTVNRMMDEIYARSGFSKCVAVVLYHQDHSSSDQWNRTKWRQYDEWIPTVGMTRAEKTEVKDGPEAGAGEPVENHDQLDLMAWAQRKERDRKEREMMNVRRRQRFDEFMFPTRLPDIDPDPIFIQPEMLLARTSATASQLRMWVEKRRDEPLVVMSPPAKSVTISCKYEINTERFTVPAADLPDFVEPTEPRSKKPPKYQPPPWVAKRSRNAVFDYVPKVKIT